ncbi:hypothetical protein ACE6H2_026585 [Prunus campanulata]
MERSAVGCLLIRLCGCDCSKSFNPFSLKRPAKDRSQARMQKKKRRKRKSQPLQAEGQIHHRQLKSGPNNQVRLCESESRCCLGLGIGSHKKYWSYCFVKKKNRRDFVSCSSPIVAVKFVQKFKVSHI